MALILCNSTGHCSVLLEHIPASTMETLILDAASVIMCTYSVKGDPHLEVFLIAERAVPDHLDGLDKARVVVLPLCALAFPPGGHLALVHAKDEQVFLAHLLQGTSTPISTASHAVHASDLAP